MAVRIIEWFVHATRNETIVHLPAPNGEDEAKAMAGHLVGFDWGNVSVENVPYVDEPEPVKPKSGSRVWPVCERCERKHSPYDHEAEGCSHCMAICHKPKAKARKVLSVQEPPAGYRKGMTFEEFQEWLDTR